MKLPALALPILILTACTSGVIPAGPRTYIITKSVSAFSSGAAGKAQCYREASEWCEKRGLVMVPISSDAQSAENGRKMGGAELTFRALPPGDPEIKRGNIEAPTTTTRLQYR